MNKSVIISLSFIPILFMLLIICTNSVSQSDSDKDNVGIDGKISECKKLQTKRKQTQKEGKFFCSDELLIWHYDQNSRTVSFVNQDVWLNCCGKHTITITFQDDSGVYVIEETDSPEGGMGRCLCNCFYDFQIKLPDIPPGTISVRLYRHITDWKPKELVWQDTLDLNQGNGDELIQANVGLCR